MRHFLSLIGLVLLNACSVSADPLRNGDFSEGMANGAPSGWFLDPAAAAKGSVAVVDGRLQLAPNPSNAAGGDGLGLGQALPAAQFHGEIVTISAELGASKPANAAVGLVALDSAGATIDSVILRHSASDGASRVVSDNLSAQLPASAQTLIVFVTVEGTAGSASFDEIIVSTAEVAKTQSTSTSTPAEPGNSAISLDLSRRSGPVPVGIFGTNVEWIRDANGLWNKGLGRVDPTILRATREAGVSLLRFPGGVWSDAYDWRDGIGPQSKRPTRPHVPGDQEKSRHSIGTDEIAQIARDIGGRLLITVNANTASPQDAAEWAAYVRDNHGADLVAMWEIGNEHYMADDMAGADRPPEEYAKLLRGYAAAIRREIPNARIAGIGMLNYGNYRFNAHDDWNDVVLSRAGDVIDAFAIHNAYAPITTENNMRKGKRVYEAMLAAPELVAQNLRDTHALIGKYQPSRASDITLAVTEWGPLFAVDPKNPFFDHAKTLGSGIFVARIFNTFLRDPNTDMATALKLSDWLNMGWIGLTDTGSWRATPALSVVELYTETLRGSLLELEITTPTFESKGTGFTAPVKSAPLVDAVASLDSNGELGLLVSSAALDQDMTVRIELPPGTWRVSEKILSGPAPDAHRATRVMDIPGLPIAPPQGFSVQGAYVSANAESVPVTQAPVRDASGEFTIQLPPTSLSAIRLTPLN